MMLKETNAAAAESAHHQPNPNAAIPTIPAEALIQWALAVSASM